MFAGLGRSFVEGARYVLVVFLMYSRGIHAVFVLCSLLAAFEDFEDKRSELALMAVYQRN